MSISSVILADAVNLDRPRFAGMAIDYEAFTQSEFVVAGQAVQNRDIPIDEVVGFLHDWQFARW